MKKYKGYTAKIEYDESAGMFHGRVLGIRDVVNFYGHSVDELCKEFHTSVDVYLEHCEETGKQPDKPCSGQYHLRLPLETHRNVTIAAESSGKSLNTWIVEVVERAADTELRR